MPDLRWRKTWVYTRSKMKPGFQIVAGAYSSYVTRTIWKVFGPGFILGWVYHKMY